MTMREMMNLSRKDTESTKSTKVPKYQMNNKICKDNNNILHINKLEETSSSSWDFGTLGLLVLSAKNLNNGYTFSDKLNEEELPSFLSNIVRLHSDVVNRDKMTIGTLNAASGMLGAYCDQPSVDKVWTSARSLAETTEEKH